MIEGYCTTNLDEYQRETWPTRFAALPRVGDVVEAKSGKILKVVRVTHKMKDKTNSFEYSSSYEIPYPIVKIELHK